MLIISCCKKNGGIYQYDRKLKKVFNIEIRGLIYNEKEKTFYAASNNDLKIYKFNKNFEILKDKKINEHVHGLCLHDDKIYLCNTYNNSIDIYNSDLLMGKSISYKKENLNFPDHYHQNDIFIKDNKIYATMFRKEINSEDDKKNDEKKGVLVRSEFDSFNEFKWEILASNLTRPHSPVYHENKIYLCNSQESELHVYDAETLQLIKSKKFDGFTRGICIEKNYIYLGINSSLLHKTQIGKNQKAKVLILSKEKLNVLNVIELDSYEIYSINFVR